MTCVCVCVRIFVVDGLGIRPCRCTGQGVRAAGMPCLQSRDRKGYIGARAGQVRVCLFLISTLARSLTRMCNLCVAHVNDHLY